ncbi:SRPBCC family protein [Daejeonella oryzae]|uniref:SRPBCC family protein n=1 Tax=Daejeonella oryzae TaxID=1122943 RepID=UPI000424634B|nr:SRPBCC domain-containing protein [Daejeonella oryzae]
MKKWYFDIDPFEAVEGFEFNFQGGSETKKYKHLCKITEVILQRKLSYSWKYENYTGNTLVTFELFPQDDKTLLKLTHQGLDSFPSDNPDFAKENFAQGWTHIIGESLKDFLENKEN